MTTELGSKRPAAEKDLSELYTGADILTSSIFHLQPLPLLGGVVACHPFVVPWRAAFKLCVVDVRRNNEKKATEEALFEDYQT